MHPSHYVDTLVGVRRAATPLGPIQEDFEHVYGVKLQVEAKGASILSLLSELTKTNTLLPTIKITMADTFSPFLLPEQMVLK